MSEAPAISVRDRLAARLLAFDERWPGARRRAAGITLAVGLEAGMIALLLTLGRNPDMVAEMSEALTTFSVAPDDTPAPEPEAAKTSEAQPRAAEVATADTPPSPLEPAPVPRPVPPIPLPLPRATPMAPPPPAPEASPGIKAVMRSDGPSGPKGSGARPGDSERISGSGPNGEPLYAARWYREPGPSELAGYLSTATSPGWALINCRTAPQWRVEDCQLVSEYPQNAGLGRAVLAAAWQFQVRPPQVGGQLQVGAWVRIRISYEIDRKRPPQGG